MSNMIRIAAFTAAVAGVTAFPALADDWVIDPAHSGAHFAVKHMMVSTVRGDFGKLSGTVSWDGKDPLTIKVEAKVDATSVDTREPKRDEHLRSPDFFDALKFPSLVFKSKRVEAARSGKFRLVGDLTIKDVTKEVVLDVEGPSAPTKNPWGKWVTGATASTKINRSDFGLTWNKALETGGVLVSDEVTITIDIEAGKQEPAPPK